EFRAPWSDRVCWPCSWASSGRPPDTFRMWSVVYSQNGGLPAHHSAALKNIDAGKCDKIAPLRDVGELCLTNRGNTSPIVDILLNPPACDWFCSIATSGQIHTLRLAEVNRSDQWAVRFERTTVNSSSSEFARALYHTGVLRSHSYRDSEILDGSPSSVAYFKNPHIWHEHAPEVHDLTQSVLMEMALWCHTKEVLRYNVEQSYQRLQSDAAK